MRPDSTARLALKNRTGNTETAGTGEGPGFRPMESFAVSGKRVLLRLDINSPLDPVTKSIVNDNRLESSVPTLAWLIAQGAKTAVIAHQGDTLDYHNLVPLSEHAEILAEKLGHPVGYIDDVCGPAALRAAEALQEGEVIILGNLRYLCEEVSTFEDSVKLTPKEMGGTWLVRTLAPLFDLYINDAFAAAHRNSPSMTAFQELLPSGAGPLFYREISALTRVLRQPIHPSVFVLGGAKISDAFGMMEQVLANGTADTILTCGVTGQVFLLAAGTDLGPSMDRFLADRNLTHFIAQAKRCLKSYPGKILMPEDLAWEREGKRVESGIDALPEDVLYQDIGRQTIATCCRVIAEAGMVFINGPAGVFEDERFADGTREIWQAASQAPGYTVVGGGDSVNAAARFTDLGDFGFVCTAGGAMVRFLSGRKLPLVEAMQLNRL